MKPKFFVGQTVRFNREGQGYFENVHYRPRSKTLPLPNVVLLMVVEEVVVLADSVQIVLKWQPGLPRRIQSRTVSQDLLKRATK